MQKYTFPRILNEEQKIFWRNSDNTINRFLNGIRVAYLSVAYNRDVEFLKD